MKNVKFLIVAIALLLVTSLSFGQGSLGKGRTQLNAGLGLSGWGVPVYVGFDYGVHPDITLGGELSFRSYNYPYKGRDYSHTIYCFAGNGNYHFNRILQIPREFDFYAGVTLGLYIWSSESGYNGSEHSGLYPSFQIGGRYFFDNNLGLNLELGGGRVSGGKIGITYKF